MSSLSFIFIGLCITFSCHNASSQLSDAFTRKQCGSNAFTCAKDHKCIPLFFRCDLKYDCTDGSDEEGCKERQCPERTHSCDWGRCIPEMFVCDGEMDCIDLSDEKDCHQQELSTTQQTPQPTEPTPPPTPTPTEPPLIIPPVNDACMQCLCQAASGCDTRLKCHKRTPSSSTLCGPYVVSEYYWMDGGRHADRGQPKDYERCLTNRMCTEKTVRGYMNRYGQDCDRDSQITCDDFARIHKLGPSSCGGDAIRGTNYWKRYEACKRRIRVQ